MQKALEPLMGQGVCSKGRTKAEEAPMYWSPASQGLESLWQSRVYNHAQERSNLTWYQLLLSWLRRSSDSEPVPTDQLHWNCRPPMLSIISNDSFISLPAQGFLVFLKFCIAVHLHHTLATTQTFNHEAASWRGGSNLKPVCISPNKMRILPCVISAML